MNTSPKTIVGGLCLTESGLEPAVLHIADGLMAGPNDLAISDSDSTLDAGGLIVAPGFVDLQINGGFGIDLMTDPDGIWDLGRLLPATGVTSFLPTLVSSPPAVIEKFLTVLGERPADYVGAEPLGAHLEGPFINPAHAGAHGRDRIRELAELSSAQIVGLARLWARDGRVALVTLAPELPGALDLIDELTDFGITVSLGHSSATVARASAAIDAGATMVTHLFNAMAGIGHRQPNLAGLALTDSRITPTIISDGHHVDPLMIRAAWNARPSRGLALVTDAVAAMGAPPGRHNFGARGVESDGRMVRTTAGVLAGSLLTMDQAISNLMTFTGCSVVDALHAATSVPARLVNQPGRAGLCHGSHADIVLLEHGADGVRVRHTMVAGQVVSGESQ